MSMTFSRRSFLFSLGALLAAPAIVRAESLMPVIWRGKETVRRNGLTVNGPIDWEGPHIDPQLIASSTKALTFPFGVDGVPIGTTNWFEAVQQALHYLDFQVQFAISVANDAAQRARSAQSTPIMLRPQQCPRRHHRPISEFEANPGTRKTRAPDVSVRRTRILVRSRIDHVMSFSIGFAVLFLRGCRREVA
jgi:hypothetical protein